MSYDFYAEFVKEKGGSLENKLEEIKSNNKKSQWQEKAKEQLPGFFLDNFSSNWYSRLKEISLFARFYENSNTDNRDFLKAGYSGYILNHLKKGDVYRMDTGWVLKEGDTYKSDLFKAIAKPKHSSRPPNSTFFHIKFILKKPYISQDDEEFYTHENPIAKDKIFKVPYVRPSSWKGALRYAAMKVVLEKSGEERINARLALLRLFGNEKDKIKGYLDNAFGTELKNKYKQKVKEIYKEEEPNVRGRLIFYPTFFDQIGLDVIAPHNRETKTVTRRGPILFETVPENRSPENRSRVFSLLYFPFDLIGDEEKLKKEASEDLEILKEAVPAMLTKYGFGAKTTSGYGVIEDKVKFQILPEMESEETDEHFSDKEKSKFVQKIDSIIGCKQ